jgi:hypothetical protein
MSKSIRRHHAQRLKAKRKKYNRVEGKSNPRLLGMLVHSAAICSCWMCGNPRKHFGEVTRQERSAAEVARIDAWPSQPR